MTAYQETLNILARQPRRWVVTGAAGFIGSNILEKLLLLGQHVVGLDNLESGYERNLRDVQRKVSAEAWEHFHFIQGDVRIRETCETAFAQADVVIHQAAVSSVPRSMGAPEETHAVNVTGFLNVLIAAIGKRVKRVVYASSSAVYGDDAGSPKSEERIGNAISPYAASKRMNELYADVFARCYGLSSVGLRYFNVYGPRQDPKGAYAAVIPTWISSLLKGEPVTINGDGKTTRDFCFIDDVVQANILAATTPIPADGGTVVCNIGTGSETSLNELFSTLRDCLGEKKALRTKEGFKAAPVYQDFRPGDIRHSCADISRARQLLGYEPAWDLKKGLAGIVGWYAASGIPEVTPSCTQ